MEFSPKNTSSFTLYIQTNSPGELTSWTGPIVKRFKELRPDSRVVILLTPCQYASGNEVEIAKKIPGVDQVHSPSQTIGKLLSFPLIQKQPGVILFLGGDPMYSQLFGLKYKIPAFAYTEHKRKPGLLFKKVFYKHVDGDLMGARVLEYQKPPEPQDPYCLFMAGSRPQHFFNLVPFYSEIATILKQKIPDFKSILLVSPFIKDSDLVRLHNVPLEFEVLRGQSLDFISNARFVVTIPGTNTAEAMYLRTPMLVLVPTHRPEFLILDGLGGLIGNLPLIGKWIKTGIVAYLKTRIAFFSHPNRLMQKRIVPELVGKFSADQVADTIQHYYQNDAKLKEIRSGLEQISPNIEILDKICNSIAIQ